MLPISTNMLNHQWIFHMEHFDPVPVTCDMVKSATRMDPGLSRVFEETMQGWPENAPDAILWQIRWR